MLLLITMFLTKLHKIMERKFLVGMGRYTYLPIRYYHDTCVPIRYVLRFFYGISFLQVLQFDIAMCCDFCFVFNSRPWEKVEWYT